MNRGVTYIAVALATAAVWGCRGKKPSSELSASTSSTPPRVEATASVPTLSAQAVRVASSATPPGASSSASAPSALRIRASDPKELGPACELAALRDGLLVRSGDETLEVLPYRDGTLSPPSGEYKCTPTGPVSVISHAPRRAYFISKGKLIRRTIADDGAVGASEVLVQDAADFTRLAVARASAGDLVGYIGREVSHELERGAKLWMEGKKPVRISPDGAGATSIAIGQIAPQSFVFLALDGRTSMSPVHLTRVEASANGLKLGEDRVVFVASGAERRSEIRYMNNEGSSLGLLPISQDASTFGLLSLWLDTKDQEAPSHHYTYPNGLDPAPVAVGKLCGRHAAAIVRPDSSDPKSLHAIELVTFDETGQVKDKKRLLTAPGIKQLVMSDVGDGKAAAYIAYTSSGRTYAAMLHCE